MPEPLSDQSVFVIFADGGYDGDYAVDTDLRYLDDDVPMPGYTTEADAQAVIDAHNEKARQHHRSGFSGYVREVRVA